MKIKEQTRKENLKKRRRVKSATIKTARDQNWKKRTLNEGGAKQSQQSVNKHKA